MDLPGRLRSTSLGDLLGALHRAAVTGTLELAEDSGRRHRVYLSKGLVAAVELDGSSPSLAEILRGDRAADEDTLRRSLLRAMASSRLHGEVLVDDFRISPDVVGNALRRQVVGRLAMLERLADARVSFRVAVRPPRGVLGGRAQPLGPHEFLHGRRRRRERGEARDRSEPAPPRPSTAGDPKAWGALGLPPGSNLGDIKRAYRRLARTVHPDLHPGASDDERRDLQRRFVELTDAYRSLVA